MVLPYFPASNLPQVVELEDVENSPSPHGRHGPSTVLDDELRSMPSDEFVTAHDTVVLRRVPGKHVSQIDDPL